MPDDYPLDWAAQGEPEVHLSRDEQYAHSGSSSVRIYSPIGGDAWFEQELTVEPETQYLLTGWIKTENVDSGTGATLSLIDTWFHSEGRFGTTDWTRVVLWFNSGTRTKVRIGARLGYPSKGTAWFDDIRLTPIRPDGSHPSWKILVLIYDTTDALVKGTDGVSHHYVGAMTQDEVERATLAATQFVETDIPALTSGNMVPELTIRYPDHPLTGLEPLAEGWWPSPLSTAPDRDPAFDSVIVIWDPRVVDEYTGTPQWIGTAAGLAPNRYAGQAYAAIIIEATGGHRNIFKHEWGHSILHYFEAIGVSPKPAVSNHASAVQYVHWPTGESYLWIEEWDANPIPNSIYNNESGFTHDYYSGTIATADQPARRLGITSEAWMWGGPVTKPGMQSSPPPVITCSGDITVGRQAGTCWASVPLMPPTTFGSCDSPVATRSDGQPLDAPFQCGRTIVTWTVTNNEERRSTCQQVVTVTDDEPPVFVNIPPPVIVNTGPEATSCGAVVDDSRLGATGAVPNPVVRDPIVELPVNPFPNDVVSMSATYDRESLTFTVSFAEKILPASSGTLHGISGFIDIDTDQNPATGRGSTLDYINYQSTKLGVDFQIDLATEYGHPGFVDIRTTQPGSSITGTVPIVFTSTSFSITVPLAMLGPDDGLVNYGVAIFSIYKGDRVPNGAVPATSVNVSEIIALDNCSGVTISRSGVPANNVFPVGQTLITYTATDASGHTAFVTQAVTVIDNTPPVISSIVASPATLWPPNREMVDVTVSYQATDNCALLGTKLSVSSNEPGDTGLDWEVVDAHRVRLRAKRTARQGARLYTITITAEDVHGNVSRQNVIVRVPQSNGKAG